MVISVPQSASDQLRGHPGGPQGSLHLQADEPMTPGLNGKVQGQASSTAATSDPQKDVSRAPTGTPSQWLGGTTTHDPMSLLAGGIAQLQAAMLTQMKEKDKPKDEDRSPEAVKPGSTTLPTLAEVNPTTSSVDVMDWLEVITSTMQDLSDGSAEWWSRARALADEAYQTWTNASPVEKLSIQPPKEVELETARWGRVNSRGASMRHSTGSVTALVFRLLTIYQPGGQQEKVMILQNLQQPEAETTAQKAVKSLRRWPRWLR